MTNEQPLSPEILLPRLGDILIEKGLISQVDLDRALTHQNALRNSAIQAPLLGQLLVELKLIDRDTLETVITEQILQLKNALVEANQQLEQRVAERTDELQKAMEKLAELNTLKANFIANISHELRTPLTHIKGYLDILVNGDLGQLTQEQLTAVSVMQRSSDRLEKLIEDLINFSMTERGQVYLNRQPGSLSILTGTVIKSMHSQASKAGIHLTVDIQDNLPLVEMDSEKILWVLQQLIENAIKFSEIGTFVQLKLEEEAKEISVSVIDNGIGIPEDKLMEIFEPFHQLDGSSTRRYGGTGLGLALANKIIEAHGSSISVTSSPGQGSRFKFSLPKTLLPY
ncbi:MAG: HAMP domain-containing histidine kinase [Anaerolineae bacterium]|jgi:signal transduction histidine kinase|nr:HAMP domain-containing histidine kinase [Anaerolineae bacterium]